MFLLKYLAMALQSFVGPWPLLQFLHTQSVGVLGWGISPSQGHYLRTEQMHTDIHALGGIRTYDPSI
jgi:hypothetical protein